MANSDPIPTPISFHVCDYGALGGVLSGKKISRAYDIGIVFHEKKDPLPKRPAEVLFTGGPNYKEKLADNLYFQSLRREAVI